MDNISFKGVCFVLVAAAGGFAGQASAQNYPSQMDRNAFLRHHVYSRAQLLAQIDRDPVALHRYEKHFRMNRSELHRYFATLHAATIPQTARYQVYDYKPDGSIGYHYFTLKKGERVFKDVNGVVAVRERCGNPMVSESEARRALSVLDSRTARRMVPAPPVEVAETSTAPEPLAPAPAAPVEAAPLIAAPVAPVVVAPPAEVPAVEAPITATTEEASRPQILAAAPALGGLFPALLGAGAIAAIASGSGGHGGGSVIGSGTLPPPAAVPEPATYAVFGLGALGFAAGRRRKRS